MTTKARLMTGLITFCREMLYGYSEKAIRARYLLLVMDIFIVSYFIVSTFLPAAVWMIAVDLIVGSLLLVEFIARVIADRDRVGLLSRPLAVLDILIIVSLFWPATVGNLAFLRVIRALRVLRSYRVTYELGQHFKFFKRHEEVIFSAVNLVAFILVVTALVYFLQHASNPSINNYIDALYFTITTLTTTGFGDIILIGSTGRLLAVVIMVVGVALFLRLAQTIFRPHKVRYECPDCGLARHELDAVHCKHCGHLLHIRTDGTD
jgi:voltage-gated potassium channel